MCSMFLFVFCFLGCFFGCWFFFYLFVFVFCNSHIGHKNQIMDSELKNPLWVGSSRHDQFLTRPSVPIQVRACFRWLHTSGNLGLWQMNEFAHGWDLEFLPSVCVLRAGPSMCSRLSYPRCFSSLCLYDRSMLLGAPGREGKGGGSATSICSGKKLGRL